MNDDQFDDLKQFIDARISQTEVRLEGQLEGLRTEVHQLRDEMRDGFAGVGEAIEELHQADAELDKQLTKLEHQAAA